MWCRTCCIGSAAPILRAGPKQGDGLNCPRKVEWLAADGRVLAVSDYEDRKQYLASVCRERAPPLAAHWQYLLNPMAAHHTDQAGALRFRHLEYYRMPLMAYLAVDHPEQLTRADFARLAYATAPGDRYAAVFGEISGELRRKPLLRQVL